MTLGFFIRHLANGRAHCVFATQRAFALHLGCEFQELQADFTRHVVRIDLGEALTPGALEPFLDGAGTGEMKRGRFKPVIYTRHEQIRSSRPGLRSFSPCAPNLT
jgi:hypothetical protein